MLKYMYADSSEFPPQRDFIDLLQRFSNAAVQTIPNQQQITDLKKRIRAMESQKESQLGEIDRFGNEIARSVDAVATSFGSGQYGPVADGIKASAREKVQGFRDSEKKKFETSLESLGRDLSKAQSSLLQIMGDFLYHDPLSIAQVEISASLRDKVYDSHLHVTCHNGTSYLFDLEFSEKEKRVSDFTEKPVQVPATMKHGVLSKEKKPRFLAINDWTLVEAVYRSNAETVLRATITKDPSDKTSPRLEMELKPGEARLQNLALVDEEGIKTDILKDDQLRRHLNGNLQELAKYLLGYFFGLMNKKKAIRKVGIDGSDLIQEDRTEAFIERAAKEYGDTVSTIRKKGLVKGELNLKAENIEGKRTELYLKIDEYKMKMSSIAEGARICSILGLD